MFEPTISAKCILLCTPLRLGIGTSTRDNRAYGAYTEFDRLPFFGFARLGFRVWAMVAPLIIRTCLERVRIAGGACFQAARPILSSRRSVDSIEPLRVQRTINRRMTNHDSVQRY